MATPPVKKAGLFGSRVSFRLQSGPSKTPRGSGDGAGDATKPLPPPPPPPPPPSRTVPSNPAVPKSAPSSSPPPQPLVPQAPLQLRPADEDAVPQDGVATFRNASGEGDDLKRITPERSFGESLRTVHIASKKSPVRRCLFTNDATVTLDTGAPESAPRKLLASKRTYISPPRDCAVIHPDSSTLGCQVTEDGVTAAINSNGEVEDLKRITLDESFGEPSRTARITAGKSPVRESIQKRIKHNCSSTSQLVDNSTEHNSDVGTNGKHRLDRFLAQRKLTKEVDIPGTNGRVSNASVLEIRVILRRGVRRLYQLHREDFALGGSFNLQNFFTDDNLFISLEYRAEDRIKYSKKGGRADLQRFVRIVREDIFSAEEMPQEIAEWLLRIETAGTDYEYLISYDSPLMEHNQTISTFMQLYAKLQRMEKTDRVGYRFVLKHLSHFVGWSSVDLHNRHFLKTYFRTDPITGKPAKYDSGVKSLLRLIRNTFQHIILDTIDENGNATFGEEDYEHMLHDQFPRLLSEFMEAMYIAGYLADLNLEYVMA